MRLFAAEVPHSMQVDRIALLCKLQFGHIQSPGRNVRSGREESDSSRMLVMWF
jgi:hypothetical protein